MPNIIGPLPVNIQNGQQADAAAVMSNLNWIQSQVNTNAAIAGGLQTVFKLTTQSITLISVPQVDLALFFDVTPGTWVFKMHIPFIGTSTNGFKFQVNGTATISAARYFYAGFWDTPSGSVQGGLVVGTSSWPSGVAVLPISLANGWVEIYGIATVTGSGNIGLYWSQDITGPNAAQVLAGAYLEFVQAL